jgi:hypothetical protein
MVKVGLTMSDRSTRRTERPSPEAFLNKLAQSRQSKQTPTWRAVPDPEKPDIVSMTERPWYILLTPAESHAHLLALELHGDTVLGVSPEPDPALDVDLSYWDAGENGVSRHHCKLRPTDSNLFVLDLESTNGTYVNGMLAAPGQAYALQDGDLITLGQLHFKLGILPTD